MTWIILCLLQYFFFFLLFSSHIIFYKFLTILSLFLSHKHNLGYANNKSVFGPFWSTLSIRSSSVYFSPLRSILVQFDLFQPTSVQFGLFGLVWFIQSNSVHLVCKVVIFKYVFCWLLFRVKFDCNFIQSYVPCICCGNLL